MAYKKKYAITLFLILSIFFCLTGIINTAEAHILIIGDSQDDNPTFYQETTQLAATLKQKGYQVLELYRDNATSESILKGMYDADAVIYAGHGGYQSGNYNEAGGPATPPFALVGSDEFIWGIGDKMREGWSNNLFYAPYKPDIPVILLHACFSVGWVENYQVANPTETIYNFARMFTGAGANYYATAWNGAEIVYDFLNGAVNFQDANNQNYEKITTFTPYNGTQIWRNSNGYAAFVGNWSGKFPSANYTTVYNESAADSWYHSNRVRNELISNFFVNGTTHQANQLVAFTEGSYDFGGQITSYFWDYGDGTNYTSNVAVNPNHAYITPGGYVVTHRVTDNLNRINESSQIISIMGLASSIYVNSNLGSDLYDGSSPTWISGNKGPMKTIYKAINALNIGGTIYVAPGTYTENINIGKKLNLMGGGLQNTILVSTNAQNATITINNSGSGSVIEGFTITGASLSSGVNLSGANNCEIDNNKITGNSIGVTIRGNNNSITGNNISSNSRGVYIGNNSQNNVNDNQISNSASDGVYNDGGSNNTIKNNTIDNGSTGITSKNSKNLKIEDNRVYNNTQEGISLDNTTGSTLNNNKIKDNHQNGIKIQNSQNNNINSNNIQNNGNSSGTGILLSNSSNNTINNNIIVGNNDDITLQMGSNQNIITYNTLNAKNLLINISNSSGNTLNKNQASFDILQIGSAAYEVKTYIETNHQLPASVSISGYNMSMSSFLELLTTAALQINKGDLDSLINSLSFSSASNPKDEMRSGNMLKSEYLKIAGDVKNYMDNTGKSPDYAYGTSLGNYFGYQNMIYTYSNIMSYYAANHTLPGSTLVDPWKAVTTVRFSTDQVVYAAIWVKNYVNNNNRLPEYVTIGGTDVNMPSFLEMLTTATLNINNGNSVLQIPLYAFSNALNPQDTLMFGSIPKAEYLKIANDVKNYMDSSGKSPDYAYMTSLGTCLGFQNLVYMYATILDNYNSSGKIPDSVAMGPWSVITSKQVVNPNAPKFTITQIKNAAATVRNYIETYHKLPDNAQIGSSQVTMSQLLEVLTTALIQINYGNNGKIVLMDFSAPVSSVDNIHAGNIPKAEYMKMANDIKKYMDSTGKTPDYAYGTSIGTCLGFQNLVYMYSMILDYYNSSGKIADWAAMEPWSVISSRPVIDPNAPKFSVDQIKIAASTVRNQIETNHRLPSTVNVNGTNVDISQFLELATTALLQITSGNSNTIILRNFTAVTSSIDNIHAGNIYKAEYLKVAGDIKNYMDNTGKSPDYAYGTSIGAYLGFQNLVYMYSMILDYYNSSGKIADWAAMQPARVIFS